MNSLSARISRRHLLRTAAAGSIALAAAPLLQACAGQSAPTPGASAVATADPTVNANLTVMLANFGNERLDPITRVGNEDALRTLHTFLVGARPKDGRRTLGPGIATAWDVSADGLTWTFTIRQDAKFHDGKVITTEDVLWSMRHIVGPDAQKVALSGGPKNVSAVVARIDQAGTDKIVIVTKSASADIPAQLSDGAGSAIGVIMPKRAALYEAKDDEAYDRNPLAAGPMKLVGRTAAASMTFERFDDYWDTERRVKFKQLNLKLVPEEATRVAGVLSGQADLAPITLQSIKQVTAGGGSVVFAPESAWIEVEFLGAWRSEYPQHDRRVRQALSYALNKDAFQKLFGGPEIFEPKGWLSASPSTIGYRPGLDPFPYDPNKARQLLADAGFPGGKGFAKMVVNTWPSSTIPLVVESALLAADQWKKELGIEVDVRQVNETTVKTETKTTEKHLGTLIWQGNTTKFDAASSLRNYYGRDSYPPDHLHRDKTLSDVARGALKVFPTDSARDTALADAYKILREEALHIGIGYLNVPWAASKRIRAWKPYPQGDYLSGLETIALK